MKKIAIVGFGPRGLSALENLFIEVSLRKLQTKFHVTLFEHTNQLGSGKVWDIKQSGVNWVNISERALKELEGRQEIIIYNMKIPSFPSYTEWLPNKDKNLKNTEADRFPPRKKMGEYLSERSESIVEVLEKNKFVTVINTLISNADFHNNNLVLKDLYGNSFTFDEVLLTIGHQPTKIDEDIVKYQIESNNNFFCFPEPYPLDDIIKSKEIEKGKNIAIRGFGLAMIDVVRALTIEKEGVFKIENKTNFESRFIKSDSVPKQIIPYSLDGLPMAPKPLNAKLDSVFKISEKQAKLFEKEIKKVARGVNKAKGNLFLKRIMAKISAEIFINLENNILSKELSKEEVDKIIISWLSDIDFKHELIQDIDCRTDVLIESFVKMACGERSISLDYCVGQVWRHCQRILYSEFSHAQVSEEIIASVIELDEQMKRYSYGPPVESMQQLLSLLKANILNLDYCNNPKITVSKNGLMFKNKEEKIKVDVIINSVLSPPKLMEVTSPIIQNLLRNDLIKPIHSELGIHTREDATIVSADKENNIPLSVLGRLSKGSVIGVDAILECFGSRIKDWATGAVNRMN
ncbi:FAD-NAD(P)-binding protein [Tenacibaculum adriaticum]|uniref:FAD-NAD(P)-binding protein n=1 Tax=Tenacibaculum adriaticum TaxID=413713 RepID=A0A5S5DPC7_9FLAO|nr:FAD/NAD(P)-binding domain-containing protein [Tenacibaculum adriaticum]TYP97575.1 FAD-NAD(P)-binding protein [Tenacibaculum adriaticum]